MQAEITVTNFRTGEHRHHVGEVWALNDGPNFIGWQTVVPWKRNGELTLGSSEPIRERSRVQEVANAMVAAENIEDARAWILNNARDMLGLD